jgi:hypothetical protein
MDTNFSQLEGQRKRVHFVEDTCFVIIDNSIVEKLHLKGEDLWVEQSVEDDEIFFRIIRKGASKNG